MGCLKALFVQVGCLVLLVAAAALAFLYRKPLWDAYHRWRGGKPPAAVAYTAPPADPAAARGRRGGAAGPRRGTRVRGPHGGGHRRAARPLPGARVRAHLRLGERGA